MSDVKILILLDEAVVAKDLESRLTTMGYASAGIVRTAEPCSRRRPLSDQNPGG